MHNPQAPEGTPEEEAKICFVGVNAFADSEQQAKHMLKPFAESELSVKSVFKVEYQQTDFSKLYHPESVDSGYGRYGVDTEWTNDLSASLHAVADHFKKTPSARTHIVAALAMNTQLHDDACFSRIGDHFLGTYLLWDDEQDDDINYAWLDETNRILAPFSEGHYVNETAGDRFPQRYQDCYSAKNWQRLKQLRKKYDPQKVFHSYLGNND
jgi:FAD/FMN-containing dehydrogenase